jgi:hypothetical protein
MKKLSALIFTAAFALVLTACENPASKSFNQCKINGLSLINAGKDETLKDTVIEEYSPVPPKITLNLSRLPTPQVMFLVKSEPEDCAYAVKGTVEFVGSNKAEISNSGKPLNLNGLVRTNIFGTVQYISMPIEAGKRRYEVFPRFFKDGKLMNGEKLEFDLETVKE